MAQILFTGKKRSGVLEIEAMYKVLLAIIILAGVVMFILAIKTGFLDASVSSINSTLNKTLV